MTCPESGPSVDGLFSAALAKLRNGQEAWSEIVALQKRGDLVVFNEAAALLESSDPATRRLGTIVLRELGETPKDGERRFRDETVRLLIDHITREKDTDVLGWMVSALGYHGGYEAIPHIVALARSDSPEIRFNVAAALPYLSGSDKADSSVIESLELLARDSDSDTRYYALSGLQEIGVSVDQISETLSLLRKDLDPQVRSLALEYSPISGN